MYRFYFQLSMLLLCVLLPRRSQAQEDEPLCGFGVETNVLGGRIVKHTKKFLAPIPPMSGAVDVNFVWQTFGRKDWHQLRHFPVVGVGITYSDYGNNDIFGK